MLHDGHWLLALGDWMLDRPWYIGARRHKAHDLRHNKGLLDTLLLNPQSKI
jgi:hypothetical protein